MNLEEKVGLPSSVSNKSSYLQGKSLTVIFSVLIVLLFVGSGFALLSLKKGQKQADLTPPLSTNKVESPGKSLIYGYWGGDFSYIMLKNLNNGEGIEIAKLPLSIKKVTVFGPNKILFINKTSERDFGQEIVEMDLISKTQRVVFSADAGFGIDDYVVSGNKTFISVWQLKTDSGSSVLVGGRSRVTALNLANGTQNLLYDEEILSSKPIHYPFGVTNMGVTITDKFLPNSGIGWGYGVDTVSFDAVQKQEISTLRNGVISGLPIFDSNTDSIYVTTYDGSKGSGVEDISGFRRAAIFPNVLTRYIVSNEQLTHLISGKEDMFDRLSYSGDDLLFRVRSSIPSNAGYFTLQNNKLKKLADSSQVTLGILDSDTVLLGQIVNESKVDAPTGNLGDKYQLLVNSFSLLDIIKGSSVVINVQNTPAQFIDVKDTSEFAQILKASHSASQKQLQLKTFSLKQNLGEERRTGQSEPVVTPTPNINSPRPKYKPPACVASEAIRCNEILGTSFDQPDIGVQPGPSADPKYVQFLTCFAEGVSNIQQCYGSPLYVYGPKGTKLSIRVGVPISNANVMYSRDRGFEIEIIDNKMLVGDELVESIEYDYTPALEVPPPKYGIYIDKNEIGEVFGKFSTDLGLNKKETQDVISYAGKVISGYAYVSYYSQPISKQILPLFFYPSLTNYSNIVFYIKNLKSMPSAKYVPQFPLIQKIKRGGVNVVETSFRIE